MGMARPGQGRGIAVEMRQARHQPGIAGMRQRGGIGVGQSREAKAHGLEQRLLPGPDAVEHALAFTRRAAQNGSLLGIVEDEAGDIVQVDHVALLFDVDADLADAGDRDDRDVLRMRDVEVELRVVEQKRLAGRAVAEPQRPPPCRPHRLFRERRPE